MLETAANRTNRYITSSYLLENRGTFSEVINILGENLLPTIFDSQGEYDESVRMTGGKFKEFLSDSAMQSLRESFSQREANELLDLQTALLSSNQMSLQAICAHLGIDCDYLQKDEDRFDVTGIKMVLTEVLKHLVNTAIENIAVIEVEDDKAGPHVHIQAVRPLPDENNDEKRVVALSQRTQEEADADKLLADLASADITDLPTIEKSCNGLYEIAGVLHAHGNSVTVAAAFDLYSRLLSVISEKAEQAASLAFDDVHENLRLTSLRYLDTQYRDIAVIADGIQKSHGYLHLLKARNPEFKHDLFESPVVLQSIVEYIPGELAVSFNPSAFFCSSMRLQKQQLKTPVEIIFVGSQRCGFEITQLLGVLQQNNEVPGLPGQIQFPELTYASNFYLRDSFAIRAYDKTFEVDIVKRVKHKVIVINLADRVTFQWCIERLNASKGKQAGEYCQLRVDDMLMLIMIDVPYSTSGPSVSRTEVEDFAKNMRIPSILLPTREAGEDIEEYRRNTAEDIEKFRSYLFGWLMETVYPVPQSAQVADDQASHADDGGPPSPPPPDRCVVM